MAGSQWQPPRFLDEAVLRSRAEHVRAVLSAWWQENLAGWKQEYRQGVVYFCRLFDRDVSPKEADVVSLMPQRLLARLWHYLLLPLLMLPFLLAGCLWRRLGAMALYLLVLGGGMAVCLLLPAGFAESFYMHSLHTPAFQEDVFRHATMVYVGGFGFLALVVSAMVQAVAVGVLLQRIRSGRWLATAGACLQVMGVLSLWWCCRDYEQALTDAGVFATASEAGAYIVQIHYVLAIALGSAGGVFFFSGLRAVGAALRPRQTFSDEEKLEQAEPESYPTDHLLEWVRVNSSQRSLLKSSYYIVLAAVLYACGLMFYQTVGCVPVASGPPKEPGDGVPVKSQEAPPVVPRILYLNPESAISVRTPKLEDSPIFKEIDEKSQGIYTVGEIKGDDKPGSDIDGAEDGMVCFLRLEHGGPGWDVGMHESSDRNMLRQFKVLTNATRVAESSESCRASTLASYAEGRKPPFVYLTGYGHIGMSGADKVALRRYLLEENGMLIADSGGRAFGSAMRALLREICPGKELADISSDDPLFQYPFLFPEGAPPLWKHTGTRALGISHNGRWIVFWHPGDMKDAWKTGHSGISAAKAKLSYQLGANVIAYALREYAKTLRAMEGMATR